MRDVMASTSFSKRIGVSRLQGTAVQGVQQMKRWMNRVEAARYAYMSVRTFSRHVRAGLLPSGYRLENGRRLWSADDFDVAISGAQPSDLADVKTSSEGAACPSPASREDA